MRDYLFQCVVSKCYYENRMLIFRVLHGREILYLIVCDLGVFQARFDVLSLGKLKNLRVFCLRICLV